jgi:hypothetical protein
VRAARRWVVVALAALVVLWPLLLAGARWPRWWEWIASEQTPMTWLQSVVLVVAGCLAALVALVLRRTGATGRDRWSWWLLAAGFAALALDERFAAHERVRDGYLAPRGVSVPFLPWVAPGDFLVMTIGLIGLAALPLVWAAVKPDPAARAALLVAVALGLVAVGMDSIDPSTWTVEGERLQQTLEEVVEQACGSALLACVTLRLLGLLDTLLPSPAPASASAEEPAERTGASPISPSRDGMGD